LNSPKYIVSALFALVLLAPGCNFWKKTVNVVDKDLGVEQVDELEKEYIGRKAWTRSLIVDLGQNGVIDRGTEVEIVELDLHWGCAVGVKGPNNRKYRHGMDIERPVTMEKFEAAMDRLFWFDKPEKRYRMNLRTFGKRTAQAIRDNELFKGMKRDAAIESWGYPDEMNSSDIGNVLQEQWIYKDPRQKTKKRYIWLVDGEVERWEE
jgi:hypothetical protein